MTETMIESGPELLLALYDEYDLSELTWQDRALCGQTWPDAFFPVVGESVRPAKRVCQACDVRTECLEYALEHGIREGVWGGTSEDERLQLRRAILGPQACPAGQHIMTAASTYTGSGGHPQCRECADGIEPVSLTVARPATEVAA